MERHMKPKKPRQESILKITIYLFAALIIIGVAYLILPTGEDWEIFYLPAAQQILAGQSPYQIPGFFNPPWILLPLLPLALLPAKVGSVVIFCSGLIV